MGIPYLVEEAVSENGQLDKFLPHNTLQREIS